MNYAIEIEKEIEKEQERVSITLIQNILNLRVTIFYSFK